MTPAPTQLRGGPGRFIIGVPAANALSREVIATTAVKPHLKSPRRLHRVFLAGLQLHLLLARAIQDRLFLQQVMNLKDGFLWWRSEPAFDSLLHSGH
jgi:hypothetical protein